MQPLHSSGVAKSSMASGDESTATTVWIAANS